MIGKAICRAGGEVKPLHSGLVLIPALLAAALCCSGELPGCAAGQLAGSASGCKNAFTTAAMRACENARYRKAARELDAAASALLEKLDEGQKEKFRLAQNAWLRFRAANAEFEGEAARGGTLGPLLKISTMADMTEARTAELKKELQQEPEQ